ncbi:MAG: alpha/beta hydrolase [Pseudomonadota bacterium]
MQLCQRLAGAFVFVFWMFGVNAAAAQNVETVSLSSGGEIAYVKTGSGEKALILIHGYSLSHAIWQRVTPLLADGYTIYAYDLRGFGASDKPDSGYTYAAMVSDLAGFMDALQIRSAVLVGHSLGGIFIQDFAAAYPDRVEGLVLANVQARDKPPLGMNDNFRKRIDAWGDPDTNRGIFEKVTPVYFKKGTLTDSDLEALVAMNMQSATPALKQAFEHLLTAPALPPEAWAKLTMPVRVIASTHDIVPFTVSVGLLDSLPKSSLSVMERSGHTPMWERPEAFASAVNDFLAGL